MRVSRTVGGVLFALLLAGCGGGLLGNSATAPAAPTGDDMVGRWFLAAPNAPPCGMTFDRASGAQQGTITPDGGCPGNFFTSRRWTLDQGTLVIDDDKNQPLAQLTFHGNHFEGQANAGMTVTLSR
jgi:hypothetical protein